MKIRELEKEGKYVYRFKHIGFQDSGGIQTPTRKNNELDEWDMVFESKKHIDKWFREVQIGLAELDRVMNYCRFFQRTQGNEGQYVRDGKSFPVDGRWDGYYIDADWKEVETSIQKYWKEKLSPFQAFLRENGWWKNWFELMDRYKT